MRLPGLFAGLMLAAAVITPVDSAGSPARQSVRPPRLLSQTGLYTRGQNGILQVQKNVMPYAPQYPLWSDGARKTRWVYLPPGSQITVSDMDRWVFPVGTKFWKEFAFEGRKVETRLIWRRASNSWVFASYAWNGAQTDAQLVPESGVADAWPIAVGQKHAIPSVADCEACHVGDRPEILGFTALQLSTDRDPNALNKETLQPGMITVRELVENRRLSPASPQLLENPPRIATTNPRTRAVLGYLDANCGGCHNPRNPANRIGLDLKHPVAAKAEANEPALVTTLGRQSHYEIPGVPEGQTRIIAPGQPGLSSLLFRMSSRGPYSKMPPLGSVIPDREAVALIESWIREDLQPSHSHSPLD